MKKILIYSFFSACIFIFFSCDKPAPTQLVDDTNNELEVEPESVMIYTIARDTPHQGLQKADVNKLKAIAARIEKLGIKTHVSG